MKDLNEINMDTEEGKLLFVAISLLSISLYHDKTIDNILEILTEKSKENIFL